MKTGGISKRLERLEAENPGPCEECGVDPNEPITSYAVERTDADEPDEPEYCPAFGRADRIVVRWADEDGGGRGSS